MCSELNIFKRLKITTICVTHDQDEASTIYDEIIVMNSGILLQVLSPIEIHNKLKSLYSLQ